MPKFLEHLSRKIEEAKRERRRRPRKKDPQGRVSRPKPKPEQRELSREEELALKPSIMGDPAPPKEESQGRYYSDKDLNSMRLQKASKLIKPIGKNLYKIRYSDQSGWEDRNIEYWAIARKGMGGFETIHQIKVGNLKEGDIVALPDAGAFPLQLSPVRIKGSGQKEEGEARRPGAKPGFITKRNPNVPATYVPGGKFYMYQSYPSGGKWNIRYMNLRTGEDGSIELSPKNRVTKVFGKPTGEEMDPKEHRQRGVEAFEKSEEAMKKTLEKRTPPRTKHWVYRDPEPYEAEDEETASPKKRDED